MVRCSKCGAEGHAFNSCPWPPDRAAEKLAVRKRAAPDPPRSNAPNPTRHKSDTTSNEPVLAAQKAAPVAAIDQIHHKPDTAPLSAPTPNRRTLNMEAAAAPGSMSHPLPSERELARSYPSASQDKPDTAPLNPRSISMKPPICRVCHKAEWNHVCRTSVDELREVVQPKPRKEVMPDRRPARHTPVNAPALVKAGADPSVITPVITVITREQLREMDDAAFRSCYNAVMAEKMRRHRAS
jgi:hypothetical protein